MLKNVEVISRLKSKYGIDIKSSHHLNKILEAMGIVENIGGDWWQTDFGMKFSPYRSRTLRANEWLESIVDFIAEKY